MWHVAYIGPGSGDSPELLLLLFLAAVFWSVRMLLTGSDRKLIAISDGKGKG